MFHLFPTSILLNILVSLDFLRWLDHYDNLRLTISFFFLIGAISEAGLTTIRGFKNSRVYIFCLVLTLAAIVETSHLILFNKTFHTWNIFWYTLSALSGILATIGFKWIWSK